MIEMQNSAEQDQIIASVRSVLGDIWPYERLVPRPSPVPNRDWENFHRLAEIGVFGLGLSAERGGVGYTLIEEVLVAREFGRFLLSPCALATLIGVHVADAAGETGLRDELVAGGTVAAATLAFDSGATSFAGEHHIVDGQGASHFLLWNAAGLAILPAQAWDSRREVPSIDTSVTLERGSIGAAFNGAWVSDAKLMRHAQILVCAYLSGMAEASVEDSVSYALVREQFGQPIAGFQALKHRCADMLARSSVAWNTTVFAALVNLSDGSDAEFQTVAAKLLAIDFSMRNGAVNIQNHGAYGFTGEHHGHLFVKRTHLLDRMGGDISHQKTRMLAATPPAAEVA